MKAVKVTSQFGHEIMALNFAKSMGRSAVIIPKAETKEEFEAESKKIFSNLSFFGVELEMVKFEDREAAEAKAWDVIGELKAGTLKKSLWRNFATTTLTPRFTDSLTRYSGIEIKDSVLMIPQKLKSDGECGVTAEQQSLSPAVFNFMKDEGVQLVLGQHFHKENDLELVENLAKDFSMYVPGMSENPHVFGIRGVMHKEYYNMYASLQASVGVAGTHTWIMLTCFPQIPQVILYNEAGVEHWKDIERAYRAEGYDITCVGFNDRTDMQELSERIEKAWNDLW